MNDIIRLIYPPASVHEFPHMALPHLKAYLKQKGYSNIKTVDFNVSIMKHIIWSRLFRVSQYYKAKGINISQAEVERNFKLAKNILFDEKDRGKDEWAIAILNAYHKMAGSDISQICLSPRSLKEIAIKHKQGYTDKITNLLDQKILELVNESPSIVGITIPMASQLFYSFYIGREIKKRVPNVKIILGGSQITLFWEIILHMTDFTDAYDHLICGEGEKSIDQYIQYKNGALTENDISGLIYINNNGKIIKNNSDILANEADLPIPDFDDYTLDDYVYPKLPYIMNKGCYWSRCTFCSYRNNYPFIKKSIDRIISDIQFLKQYYNVRFFHFIDDAIPPNVLLNFSNQILETGTQIKYESYLRFDPAFTPELCKKIAQSGLRSALFGLESANLRILKLMKKGVTPQIALKILNNMTYAGIKPVVSCMIGFPSETQMEAMETISFLKSHKDIISQAFLVRYGLISDMKDCADEYGIYDIKTDDLFRYDDAGFVALGYSYKTYKGMTETQIIDTIRYGRAQVEGTLFLDCFFS